jgi:membrane associated rhomboid family serine protease
MTDDPRARLAQAQQLLDGGDPDAAIPLLEPLTDHPDPQVAGAAWIALGTAHYRADDEQAALQAWQRAAELGGPMAWLGWRSAAEQHVRDGDLDEAIDAYREADRRAPPQERGAIANRIAWLLKETGHDFEARRQFNRARGAYGSYPAYVTWLIIAVNIAVYVIDGAMAGGQTLTDLMGGGGPLVEAGAVSHAAVASGQWWTIFTSAFLHLGLLHIGFNMYALWLFGPIIEQLYGHIEYFVIYLLCAVGGSVLTILAAPETSAAGASGAIFGLFGLAFVVSRRRHLLLGPQARSILSQAGGLLLFNLIITFAIPRISWTGHVGGLLVGALIGLLLVPSNVPSMGGLWRAAPDGRSAGRGLPLIVRAVTYAAVAAILAGGTLLVAKVG